MSERQDMTLVKFIQRCLDQHYESMLRSVEGLTQHELSWRPNPQSMSIGFLVWHYGRTLDRWIHTRVLETLQLWEQGWASRFDHLSPDPDNTGYGHTSDQLEQFRVPSASILLGYARAAKDKTMEFLGSVDDDTLDKVMLVNPRGGHIPLVVMFQQLVWEVNQHGGQIAYLRGLQRGIEDRTYTGGALERAAQDAQ